MTRYFSQTELDRRYAALRVAMNQAGYSVLLIPGVAHVQGRAYFRYLTDFQLWSTGGYLLFFADDEPIVVMKAKAQIHGVTQLWVKDGRAADEPIEAIKSILAARSIPGGRLGIVGLRDLVPAADYLLLVERFPGLELVDASEVMNGVMRMKSAEEIALFKESARCMEAGFEAFRETIRPGATGWQLWGEVQRGVFGAGGTYSVVFITPQTGENPYMAAPTDRPLEEDDIVLFSVEGHGANGYWPEVGGMFSFREPPDTVRRMFDCTVAAHRVAVDMMRPGVTGGAIGSEIARRVGEAGYSIGHWSGHGVGLRAMDQPWIASDEMFPLEAGVVIALHPNIVDPRTNVGVYASQTFVVTPNGGEPLTTTTHAYEWHVVGR